MESNLAQQVEPAVLVHQPIQSKAVALNTPAALLQIAMDQGADLDRLERLYDMQLKWEANEARKAFVAAMAEFKKNPPEILKDKHVSFENNKGGITQYNHATIGGACEKIIPALAALGFSHKWNVHQPENSNGLIVVTCVVTHALGHSEETTLKASRDSSGGKNDIQAVSSTITYLERYTLLAAVGLAPKDMPDDDGRGSETGAKPDVPMLTKEHQQEVVDTAARCKVNVATILKHYKATELSQIPDAEFDSIISGCNNTVKNRNSKSAGANKS